MFLLTEHAINRYIARCAGGVATFAEGRRQLATSWHAAVRVPLSPARGRDGHSEWRITTPVHCVLVTVESAPDEHTIVTVLGPDEAYTPIMRDAVPGADRSRAAPPRKLKAKRFARRKHRDFGTASEATIAAAELADYQQEMADRNLPATQSVTTTDDDRKEIGMKRDVVMREYHRLTRAAKEVAEMVLEGGHSATVADAEMAVAAMMARLPAIDAAFGGKESTMKQVHASLLTAQNRLDSVRGAVRAAERAATALLADADREMAAEGEAA